MKEYLIECIDRTFDDEDYYKINKYIEDLEEKMEKKVVIMEKYLELISDLALDYDGCNTIESLKALIDELDRLARLGRVCNTKEPIYENNGKKYNILHEEILRGENNEK